MAALSQLTARFFQNQLEVPNLQLPQRQRHREASKKEKEVIARGAFTNLHHLFS